MAELTTAEALGRFYDELVELGFDEAFSLNMTQIAGERILEDEGLIVSPDEDEDDPEQMEVGTATLRIVPDLSAMQALVNPNG